MQPRAVPDPGQAAEEFVVRLDRDALLRIRSRLLRRAWLSAAVTLVGGAVLVAYAIAHLGRFGDWFFVLVPVALGLNGYRIYRLLRELGTWQADQPPAVAMRMSPRGLTLQSERLPRPVFLPWPTVVRFSVHGRSALKRLLVHLAAGVDASTPGTTGLDQPEALAMLRPRLGRSGLRFVPGALRPPVVVIDQALAHYTDGQVRVRPLV